MNRRQLLGLLGVGGAGGLAGCNFLGETEDTEVESPSSPTTDSPDRGTEAAWEQRFTSQLSAPPATRDVEFVEQERSISVDADSVSSVSARPAEGGDVFMFETTRPEAIAAMVRDVVGVTDAIQVASGGETFIGGTAQFGEMIAVVAAGDATVTLVRGQSELRVESLVDEISNS